MTYHPGNHAVRAQHYHYIQYRDGSEELYDLKNDPEELNDLSASKRETAAELLNEIKQKLTEVNEPYQ